MPAPAKRHNPQRDAIFQAKGRWGRYMFATIAHLIAFRQAMMGKAVPYLGTESYRLSEPVPSRLPDVLETVTSEFEHAATEARAIIDAQNQYASTRHPSGIPTQTASFTAEDHQEIQKIASWWGSRAKTWFQFGDETRKYRRELIRDLVDTYRDMDKLQDAILSSDKNSIHRAISNFSTVLEKYAGIFKQNVAKFKSFIDKKSPAVPSTEEKAIPSQIQEPGAFIDEPEGEPEVPVDETFGYIADVPPAVSLDIDGKFSGIEGPSVMEHKVKEYFKDARSVEFLASYVDKEEKALFRRMLLHVDDILVDKWEKAKDSGDKSVAVSVANEIADYHNKILERLKRDFNMEARSAMEILTRVNAYKKQEEERKAIKEKTEKISRISDPDLKKLAQSSLSRWIKRKLRSILGSENRIKAQTADIINKTNKMIDRVMDLLERKQTIPASISSMVEDIDGNFIEIYQMLQTLAGLHNAAYEEEEAALRGKKGAKPIRDKIYRSDFSRMKELIYSLRKPAKKVEKIPAKKEKSVLLSPSTLEEKQLSFEKAKQELNEAMKGIKDRATSSPSKESAPTSEKNPVPEVEKIKLREPEPDEEVYVPDFDQPEYDES